MNTALFVSNASKTISNTTTETSGIPLGIGTLNIPGNSILPGSIIRIKGFGFYSTPMILPSSVTIRIKLNSTVLASITTSSILTGANNEKFSFEAFIDCYTDGINGNVVVAGDINYKISGSKVFDDISSGITPIGVNTTIDQLLDVTIQWSDASTTRSATITLVTIEAL